MSSEETSSQQERFEPSEEGGQDTARLFWNVLSSFKTTIALVWLIALMLAVASGEL